MTTHPCYLLQYARHTLLRIGKMAEGGEMWTERCLVVGAGAEQGSSLCKCCLYFCRACGGWRVLGARGGWRVLFGCFCSLVWLGQLLQRAEDTRHANDEKTARKGLIGLRSWLESELSLCLVQDGLCTG